MPETKGLGVEIEPVGWRTIQGVALDGDADAFGMCAVHAELVGAPCQGMQLDAVRGDERIVRHGLPAMFEIHFLSRPVGWHSAEWQVDLSAWREGGVGFSLQQGDVGFLYFPVFELLLQVFVYRGLLGDDEESGSGHVEAVDDEWTCRLRTMASDK